MLLTGEVRIILIAAEFSKEVTATVLWLREYGIDMRCVRLVPYRMDDRLLVHADTVLPMPEAKDYLVKIAQKEEEVREAKQSTSGKMIPYDLNVGGQKTDDSPMPRKRVFHKVVKFLVQEQNISPEQLRSELRYDSMWEVFDAEPTETEVTERLKQYEKSRYDWHPEQWFRSGGKCFILRNQNSDSHLPKLRVLVEKLHLESKIRWAELPPSTTGQGSLQ